MNMSITVSDCLALRSLKDATVVGGMNGLDKIVASVSVLEYADVSLLNDDLFVGNEMILTALVTVKDDVEKQCQVIRHLYMKGTVVLVLYYIGIIVPKLDKRLINVANELDMPLIAMPKNCLTCRYGEVISEVTEMIFHDRIREKYFVPTIIDTVAQLPDRQRTLDNVLRILSNQFRLSIFVTDEQLQLIAKATWPVSDSTDILGLIDSIKIGDVSLSKNDISTVEHDSKEILIFFSTVRLSTSQKIYIFVVLDSTINSSVRYDKTILFQISESIELIESMQRYSDWPKSSNLLINAILNNDSYLMKQIAFDSNVEIKSIHNMWILILFEMSDESLLEILTASKMFQLKAFLSDRFATALVGNHGDSIVALTSEPQDQDASKAYQLEFMDETGDVGRSILICVDNLQTTHDVREAYDKALDNWYTLKSIYQNQRVFNLQELNFAMSCQKILQQKEDEIKEYVKVLEPLLSSEHTNDYIETLTTFLLDANRNIDVTAKIMHLHSSSIKYRLKIIQQKINRNIKAMPDAIELYMATALNRIYYNDQLKFQ